MTSSRNRPGRIRPLVGLGLTVTAFAASSAVSQPLRELCPTRPGLGTAPCVVDEGKIVAELGVADWTIDKNADSRTDTVILGNLLVRYGISDRTEIQLVWSAYGHSRERDRASGAVSTNAGTGDLTLAFKHSMQNQAVVGFRWQSNPF